MCRDEAVDVDEDCLLYRVVFAQAVYETLVRIDGGGRDLDGLAMILAVIDEEESDLHGVAHVS